MKQVNEAELVWRVRYQLTRVSASLRRDLASRQADTRRRAENLLAEQLVRTALGKYEILSSTPLPSGTDLFSAAAFGTGGGHAPKVEPDEEP